MARYINEDDLLVKIMDLNLDHVQGDDGRELCQVIQALPTADVREVVHGEWIVNNHNMIECSVCHKIKPYDVEADLILYFDDIIFCPHCGADMRGVNNGKYGTFELETQEGGCASMRLIDSYSLQYKLSELRNNSNGNMDRINAIWDAQDLVLREPMVSTDTWISTSEELPVKSGKYIVYGTERISQEYPEPRNHIFIGNYDADVGAFGFWCESMDFEHAFEDDAETTREFIKQNILYWITIPLLPPDVEGKA